MKKQFATNLLLFSAVICVPSFGNEILALTGKQATVKFHEVADVKDVEVKGDGISAPFIVTTFNKGHPKKHADALERLAVLDSNYLVVIDQLPSAGNLNVTRTFLIGHSSASDLKIKSATMKADAPGGNDRLEIVFDASEFDGTSNRDKIITRKFVIDFDGSAPMAKADLSDIN